MTRAAKKTAATEIRHRRARASDGVSIAYTLWRRPARELLVLAPGFWRVRLGRENLFLANHFVHRATTSRRSTSGDTATAAAATASERRSTTIS